MSDRGEKVPFVGGDHQVFRRSGQSFRVPQTLRRASYPTVVTDELTGERGEVWESFYRLVDPLTIFLFPLAPLSLSLSLSLCPFLVRLLLRGPPHNPPAQT